MKRWLITQGPSLGLAGIAVIVAASVVAALTYSGLDGEPYSPLNHTVSELGERGVSELALIFNSGLVLGGTLVALSMLGLGFRYGSIGAAGTGLFGAIAGVSVMFVGLFPVDDFEAHYIAAIAAFLSLTFVAGWFAVWVGSGRSPFTRSLGILAAWIVVAMIGFTVLPGIAQPEYTFQVEFDPDPPPRPDIWLAAALEWVVFASALAWIGLLSWARHRMSSAESEVQPVSKS